MNGGKEQRGGEAGGRDGVGWGGGGGPGKGGVGRTLPLPLCLLLSEIQEGLEIRSCVVVLPVVREQFAILIEV